MLEERDAADETLATYVYGNYVDEVLTMHRDGEDYYYHQDDLFSVIAVTDEAGDVVESYTYGDYGAPMGLIFTGAGSSIGNPYLFQGREWDPETEFYHYRTRYLEPTWGRFTTRDTIGIWGDRASCGNGTTAVGSNPWTLRDPHGMGAFDTGADAAYAEISYSLSGVSSFGVGGGFTGGLQIMANCTSKELDFFVFVQGSALVGSPGLNSTANLGLGLVWNLSTNSIWTQWGVSVGMNLGWSATEVVAQLLDLADEFNAQYGYSVPNPVINVAASVLRNVPHRGFGFGASVVASLSAPFPTGVEFSVNEGIASGVSGGLSISYAWHIGATHRIPNWLDSFVCGGCGPGASVANTTAATTKQRYQMLIRAARPFTYEIEQEWLYTPMGAQFFDPFGGADVPY